MQVFVPYPNPIQCAAALDFRRLNKQIFECKQIIKAIRGESTAWKNHPVVKMYRDHVYWLECYQHCLECYRSSQILYSSDHDEAAMDYEMAEEWSATAQVITPGFLTDEFTLHHKVRLYTKEPEYYTQWSNLGTSEENWYFVDGKMLVYKEGRLIRTEER